MYGESVYDMVRAWLTARCGEPADQAGVPTWIFRGLQIQVECLGGGPPCMMLVRRKSIRQLTIQKAEDLDLFWEWVNAIADARFGVGTGPPP